MIGGSTCRTRSSWSLVVERPSEKRTAPCATILSIPIATNTCDGSVAPDVQAEPEDTARPTVARRPLLSYLGAGKGVYPTPEDAVSAIRKLRDEWP